MDSIEQIVAELQLLPHPEGGFYREMYRSESMLAEPPRNLMTSIYFLLTSANVSKFHRIKSDELWFYHAGSPLIVHTLDDQGHKEMLVGPRFSEGQKPQILVPKDTIFGSSVFEENGYSLVSCVVAPGFDFEDFELFTKDYLLGKYPTEEAIISRLT
jgi:predicted cupin superfamily sugar epimerase